MSKTQAFTAFELIMRCLFWMMMRMANPKDAPDDFSDIYADYYEFMQESE